MASDVINGRFYVAGGVGSGDVIADVEAYDPTTNTWTSEAPMPTAAGGATAGAINGVLYVAAGSIQAYDPVRNTWTIKALMPTARITTAGGVVNGVLYEIGRASCRERGEIW